MAAIFQFLYEVEFPPYANPPHTKERFEGDLSAYLKSHRLRFLMSGLGGNKYTRGVVYRKRWGVKELHRVALADWIKAQRICCIVRLGALEEDTDDSLLVREITEWVFEVDNLTKEDRQAAAAHKRSSIRATRKAP